MMTDLTEMRISKDKSLATFWTPMIPVEQKIPRVDFPDLLTKREVRVCAVDTPERLGQAGNLVKHMYARKNYRNENIIRQTPQALTLISYSDDRAVIGTITISLDSSEEGLLADGNYPEELNKMRAQGKRLCEFNALAIDASIRSKVFVARLFHIAMLYPWGIVGHKDLVIEVTPSHSRFYKRMLGFKQIGEERVCPRVNTPGILMYLSLEWATERIKAVGGLGVNAKGDKTLYPYFFGKADSTLILDRMRGLMNPPSFDAPILRYNG